MSWESDEFYGGNFTVQPGENNFIIGPGGNISVKISEKYIGCFAIYLSCPEEGERLDQLILTNGTHSRLLAKYIPLSNLINLQFTSPRYVPTNWYMKAVFHFNSTKPIALYTEILNNPQEEL